MMPSPWPDQLSGGLAASRPDISRRPRWPKEGRTRGYITRASIPKEVVARLESDRVRGRGRGRGGQREATANWRCYLEYDSQTVGNWGESCTAALDHGRRSTELRISISPRACWPLPTSSNSIGERPCFWLGRWLDVCSRRCGRQADSVGRRLVPPSSSWAGAWPISKWYDDTRPWCSVCWAESTNWPCIDVSCFATQKSAGVRTKTSKWRREFGEVGGAINLLKPAIFTLADGTHAPRLFQRCCRRETNVLV